MIGMIFFLLLAALVIAALIALAKADDPLWFQWPASLALIVGGLFSKTQGAEDGFALFFIFLGVLWLVLQPLPVTIARMRKIERGEKV